MLIIFAFVNSHAKIEKDEILGLWLFDDGKGNALKDSSGNDNHSKLIDGPIFLGIKLVGAPNGDYWNGKIDEVAVLSRGITQA